jgi:hypothetical protein
MNTTEPRTQATVNVAVRFEDCTGDGQWTAEEFRAAAKVFLKATDELEKGTHGCL